MNEIQACSPARALLLRLAAGDERSLREILRPRPEPASGDAATAASTLDRRTRLLVGLGALLALDASTDSLTWAVELASTAGIGDDALAAVLLATGSATGSAQLVSSAARLAIVLGYDTGVPEDPALTY